jgi:two-component system, NtrC family, response regulator PilR
MELPLTRSTRLLPPHVVIAEDDDGIRDVLEMLFTEAGFRVTICANLDRARAAIQRQQPQLLISDLRLGSSTHGGLDLVRDARLQVPQAPEAILLTGMLPATISAEIKALEALGGHLMSKPFDIDSLLDLAHELTGWPDKSSI